jgi:hypothetical protein
MTNLKSVHGFNTYCGPAVISAITGESTDRCAAVISAVSGKKEIRAVEWKHLIQTFHRLRFECKQVSTGSTLYGTIIKLSHTNGFYIIGVPRHVIAIEVVDGQVFLIDNHSKDPLPAQSSARLSQMVDIAYKVVPKDTPKFVSSVVQLREVTAQSQLDIIRLNKYEKTEDDTTTHLGYIKYTDVAELQSIIRSLKDKYGC